MPKGIGDFMDNGGIGGAVATKAAGGISGLGGDLELGLGAFEVISGLQQADLITRQADLQQRVAKLNAKYAMLDAANAREEGYSASARYQDVIDTTVSTERTNQASEGVDVSFGSAKEVQTQSKLNGFLNQLDIQNQANQKAQGYENQATNYLLQGASAEAQGAISAAGATTRGTIAGLTSGLRGYDEFTNDKSPSSSNPEDASGYRTRRSAINYNGTPLDFIGGDTA